LEPDRGPAHRTAPDVPAPDAPDLDDPAPDDPAPDDPAQNDAAPDDPARDGQAPGGRAPVSPARIGQASVLVAASDGPVLAAPDGPVPRHLLPDTATIGPDGRLAVGGVTVEELAERFGTPLFVYDEAHLRARCRAAVDAWGDGVAYATKAFLCVAMARLAADEGMWLDVSTGGELHVALAAGVPPERLVLHGNNKSEAELAEALRVGVGRIVVDSFDEIDRLARLTSAQQQPAAGDRRGPSAGAPQPPSAGPLPLPSAGDRHGPSAGPDPVPGSARPQESADTATPRGWPAGPVPVLVRVTPGVEVHTHEFVRTGQDDSKFGFGLASGAAAEAVARLRGLAGVALVGIHAHIGSQVFDVASFAEAVTVLVPFVAPLGLPELCVGGGLGVAYVDGEPSPSMAAWAAAVRDACRRAGLPPDVRVTAEPGRSIVATAGLTVYRIGTIKDLPGIRTYVAVDGGMSDNPRPVLYGSGYEAFLARAAAARRPRPVRVVGKHCESGDVVVAEGRLPDDVAVGDLLVTPVTGAYGYAMASTYNKVPRPAVVFVADGRARLVVRRESLDDLLRLDVPLEEPGPRHG
jgi:diaminopimelate decarboxylase